MGVCPEGAGVADAMIEAEHLPALPQQEQKNQENTW
jgi:hypothetical protein